jgi:signal peptidase II
VSLRARAWNRAGLLLGLVLLVDQVSKRLARSGLAPGDEDPIFPGLKLVHVRNRGVAFGAFAEGQALVIVVVAVALLALLVWFALHADRRAAWLPTGLLLGGALGNVFDRIRDGAVTDFFKLPGWPAFNVADIAITLGVLSLLWVMEGSHDDEAPGPA